MKKIYETPEVEVVNFVSLEELSVVSKEEDLGSEPGIDFVSREF